MTNQLDLASRTRSGADALIDALADSGVTHCFSNPGTSELDLVLALERQDRVANVPVVFEGVASGAADGFARISGRPAATLLHLAPGWHNACANLHNATKAGSPVVNLVGDHAVRHRSAEGPLSADLPAFVEPASAWWARVDRAEDMAVAGQRAVAEAVAHGGVASLLIAMDAAGADAATERHPEDQRDAALARSAATGRALSGLPAIADALAAARRPALLLGGSALHERGVAAAARLAALGMRVFSEHFPARQARGGGRFALDRLPYFTEAARAELAGCDLLVALGTPLPSGTFAYPGRPDAHLPDDCRGLSAGVSLADAEHFLGALADAIGAPPVATAPFVQAPRPKPEGPVTALALGHSLHRHLPEGAIVSDDSVTASGLLLATTTQAPAHDWLVLTGGALGQGLPLAIGAALAAPGRRVVCITGDGAFLYTNQALWTLARENLNVTVIVIANRSYEVLKYELTRMPGAPLEPRTLRALHLAPPVVDHVLLARSFGVPAVRVDFAADLDSALETALATSGPVLIEAVV